MFQKRERVQTDIPWVKIGLFALLLNLALSMGPIGFCLLVTFVIVAWVIETFVSLSIVALVLLGRLCVWLWERYQTNRHP